MPVVASHDIIYDANMQELNAVVLYVVIFVIFVSLRPSYSSACHTYCKKLMHAEKALV